MSLLGLIRGGYSTGTPSTDQQLRPLRRLQKLRDHEAIRYFLANINCPNEREYYIWGLSKWRGKPAFFDHWVQNEPQCGDAHLLRGAHAIEWAWEARTSAQASDVTAKGAQFFWERLLRAQQDLQKAASLIPNDPLPHALLVTAGLGLGVDKPQVLEHYQHAITAFPQHRYAHQRTLWYLCEKWLGSHKAMFDFAREACERAPEGSPVHVVMANAYIERWLFYIAFENDPMAGEALWAQPKTRSEIKEAYQRSIGSHHHKETPMSHYDRNFFALCLAKTGEKELALKEMNLIGKRPALYPWAYVGLDEVNGFKKTKRAMGLG